jgi:uncharacterized protein (DUF58 family)
VKLELARLNHILVPSTKSGRDRYRNGRLPRRLRTFAWFYTRLSHEGRALLAVVGGTGILAIDVAHTESHLLVLAAASLIFASLLFTRLFRLEGVDVQAHAARRVTVGDELALTVSLTNHGARQHRSIRLERPRLPWDGTWSQASATIAELGPGDRVSMVLHARFAARGEHQLDAFRAATLLPLGLTQGAPLWTEGVRFVVVPKIARVISVTMPKNQGSRPGSAVFASRVGDRAALAGVRPYRPGDPVRDLHARSWARHGVPVVREYHDELFSGVGLVLDTHVKPGSARYLEAGLSLAAGVIAALRKADERVDVLVMGEHAERLSLGRNQASLEHALDVLAAVQASSKFEPARILASVGPHLERLSSVIFIALEWDEQRAAVVAAIRSRGFDCTALLVAERSARAPNATTVAIDAIVNGEAIAL